jgi:hypothetical protein
MAKEKTEKSSMVDKLLSNSSSKFANMLIKSPFFNDEELIDTNIPMLNVALSGRIDGGLCGGVTMLAGESKRFKSLFGLLMMSAFLKKYPTAAAIIYDTEFGTQKNYFEMVELDTSRVVHIPINCVENLKHEVTKQLDALTKMKEDGEDIKVFMFVDSIGNMASRKEINDALEESEKADMTRAKQLKSFFRIVTSTVKMLNIPFVCINHVYKSQGSFIPYDIVSGGTGPMLSADSCFVISRAQEKNTQGLLGYNFTLNIEKSRFVMEKSKIPITVHFEDGIHKFSGLAELAVEFGIIEEIRIGKSAAYKWKEVEIKDCDIDTDEAFWNAIFENTDFKDQIRNRFELSSGKK